MSAARAGRARGFTLIEMVVTVAIVGLLASIAFPLAELGVRRSREHELRQALRELRTAIDAYKQAVDEGRIAKQADESGYPPSLEVLVEGVEDRRRPDRARLRFLRRLPRDPFAADPGLPAAQSWGRRSHDSPPEAPAEGRDVFDVYSLSPRVGLDGTPYREW